MSWTTYHRRRSALHDILAAAEQQQHPDPRALLDAVPGARDAFPDEADVLRELQMTWFQSLSGALDQLLGEGPTHDLESGAMDAWVTTAQRRPVLRRMLDAAEDRPELASGRATEHRALAAAVGRRGDAADAHGARLRAAAQERTELPALASVTGPRGLVARLRQAWAA